MIIEWWLHLLGGRVHYIILLGAVAQILGMTNNIMTLGYAYDKRRLKKPPDILCKIAHIGRIIAWILSRLAWNTELRGRDQSLLRPIPPKAFSRSNNQEVSTTFDTSTRYMLWDLGCTQSANPYFELYTELKNVEKGEDTEVNDIVGIIKPKGIGTVVLDLEDGTGKLHTFIFEQVYYFPRAPKLLVSPQKWARDKI